MGPQGFAIRSMDLYHDCRVARIQEKYWSGDQIYLYTSADTLVHNWRLSSRKTDPEKQLDRHQALLHHGQPCHQKQATHAYLQSASTFLTACVRIVFTHLPVSSSSPLSFEVVSGMTGSLRRQGCEGIRQHGIVLNIGKDPGFCLGSHGIDTSRYLPLEVYPAL